MYKVKKTIQYGIIGKLSMMKRLHKQSANNNIPKLAPVNSL